MIPLLLAACGRAPTGLHISKVEANPGVSIPLAIDGAATTPEERAAPIPPDRALWILVSVDVDADWVRRDIAGTLTLETAEGETHEVHDTRTISRSTDDWATDPSAGFAYDLSLDEFEGFAFPVDADLVQPGVSWRVELAEADGSGKSLAFPEDVYWTLPVEPEAQTLRLELQPIDLDVQGCSNSPDLSDSSLAGLFGNLEAIYPLGTVEVTKAPPLTWTHSPLSRDDLLDAVASSRADRSVPAEIYTYGILEVCDGIDPPSPIGGSLAEPVDVPGPDDAPFLAAVLTRVDYDFWGDGPYEEYVFSHELMHLLGRIHAPCGDPALPDPNYPNPDGTVGDWGIDPRSERLYNPTLAHDYMAYCQEMWISRYTWTGLWERMRAQSDIVAPEARSAPEHPLLVGVVSDVGATWRVAKHATVASVRSDGLLTLVTPTGRELVAVEAQPTSVDGETLVEAVLPSDAVLSASLALGDRRWNVPAEAFR